MVRRTFALLRSDTTSVAGCGGFYPPFFSHPTDGGRPPGVIVYPRMAYQGLTLDNPFTGQSIHFLITSRQTQGRELVLQSSWRGHSPEPPAHYHPGQEELFEVLQGQLTVRLAGELHQLQAGQQLRIGPGQPHSMWNAGAERAIARWTTRPARRTEELLETTFSLAQAGLVRPDGTPGLLQAAVLLTEFDQEFRLVRPARWAQRLGFGLLRPVARLLGVKAHYGAGKPQPEAIVAAG